MKKVLIALLFLLTFLTFIDIPKGSATITEDGLRVTMGLPSEVPREPIPGNFTTEDYLNTTNPYSDLVSPQGGIDEVDDPEGANPIYVLVFGDEEEREVVRHIGPEGQYPVYWDTWAKLQLERGDEALVANFGIDIRILGFQNWDSNDGYDSMYELWLELESDTEQYLGQWYNGEWWSNHVDAVIGITSQDTPGDSPPVAGLTPEDEYLDQGRTFTLLKWQVYWMDDNLVQHEVSHLFYAPDHYNPCCAMATHTHFQWYIWEDGIWWVLNDVYCAYTSYHWCSDCQGSINAHKQWPAGYQLSVSAGPDGTTSPLPGTYTYRLGAKATVTASPFTGYEFDVWLLDGAAVYDNPTEVNMTSDHTLQAYFKIKRYQLRISVGTSCSPGSGEGGTTNPSPGTHTYNHGTTVTVTATAHDDYCFEKYILDGENVYAYDPYGVITVTMDSDHTLEAVFLYTGGGGGGGGGGGDIRECAW